MKANPVTCHQLRSTNSPEVAFIDGMQLTSSNAETILSITIDPDVNFEKLSICHLSIKINALGRIANYMSLEKRRIMMKTFIESQFNYCPLIWIFHSQTSCNKVLKSTLTSNHPLRLSL